MDDLVDEVDEHDQPTGRLVSRAVVCAGSSLVLHRCVGIYAFDSAGRLLVQTHKKTGLYDHSVGGHVDAGEDYPTAARREAAEELGLTGVTLREIVTSVHAPESSRAHMFGIYECVVDDAWTFVPNDEVDEVTPLMLEHVVRLVNDHPERFTRGFMTTLQVYLRHKGR